MVLIWPDNVLENEFLFFFRFFFPPCPLPQKRNSFSENMDECTFVKHILFCRRNSTNIFLVKQKTKNTKTQFLKKLKTALSISDLNGVSCSIKICFKLVVVKNNRLERISSFHLFAKVTSIMFRSEKCDGSRNTGFGVPGYRGGAKKKRSSTKKNRNLKKLCFFSARLRTYFKNPSRYNRSVSRNYGKQVEDWNPENEIEPLAKLLLKSVGGEQKMGSVRRRTRLFLFTIFQEKLVFFGTKRFSKCKMTVSVGSCPYSDDF